MTSLLPCLVCYLCTLIYILSWVLCLIIDFTYKYIFPSFVVLLCCTIRIIFLWYLNPTFLYRYFRWGKCYYLYNFISNRNDFLMRITCIFMYLFSLQLYIYIYIGCSMSILGYLYNLSTSIEMVLLVFPAWRSVMAKYIYDDYWIIACRAA